MFEEGPIEGVVIKNVERHTDERGWLAELFRQDEIGKDAYPVMAYISLTLPNVVRGPHQHLKQTDYFAFLGPSNFKLFMWDNRPYSKTSMKKTTLIAGEDDPKLVTIPPGVVHAYKNIGEKEGFVLNFPNRLYKGFGRGKEIDEIRYESDPLSPYTID